MPQHLTSAYYRSLSSLDFLAVFTKSVRGRKKRKEFRERTKNESKKAVTNYYYRFKFINVVIKVKLAYIYL